MISATNKIDRKLQFDFHYWDMALPNRSRLQQTEKPVLVKTTKTKRNFQFSGAFRCSWKIIKIESIMKLLLLGFVDNLHVPWWRAIEVCVNMYVVRWCCELRSPWCGDGIHCHQREPAAVGIAVSKELFFRSKKVLTMKLFVVWSNFHRIFSRITLLSRV